MNQHHLLGRGLVFAICAVTTSACAPIGGENDVESASSSVIYTNSLVPIALDATSLFPAALTPAMLSGAALDPGRMSAPALAAIQDPGESGWVSRELLSYTVGCAFDSTESLSFTWVDAEGNLQSVTDRGMMGLATDWAYGALGADEQPWVSACLAARVNYFGTVVQLSLRGKNPVLATTPAEVSAYPNEEGAFWGNLFSDSPAVYACDDVDNDENSRSLHRVCAAGYVDAEGDVESCGIIQRLGSCATYCEPLTGDGGQYYPACATTPILDGGDQALSLTSQPIAVFLQ